MRVSVILWLTVTARQSFQARDMRHMHNNTPRVAIIGAGLAGLSAATTLRDAGLQVSLFERLKKAGGRLGEAEQVDMGAQYFTARHPAFRQASREWQAQGWVADWTPQLYFHDQQHGLRLSSDNTQRLVGVPGMCHLGQRLQQDLPLTHADISYLQETADGGWMLSTVEGDEHGPFSAVIVATPAEVATQLLAAAPQLQQDVGRVRMRPCWSVALQFHQPLATPVDACFVRDGPLDWLARNNSKPQRPDSETWLLQSTASWAEQHAHSSPEQVITELTQAMAKVLGLQLSASDSYQAHYWSHARPAEQVKWGALASTRLNLYVCGDWCLGGRIENAWLSGRQAAKALLNK